MDIGTVIEIGEIKPSALPKPSVAPLTTPEHVPESAPPVETPELVPA